MKIPAVNISRVAVVAALVVIAGAAFYGLANGTILQHRSESVVGAGSCDGACSDCTEADAGLSNGLKAAPASIAKNAIAKSAASVKTSTPTTIPKLQTLNGALIESKTATGSYLALKTTNSTYLLDIGPEWYLQYKKYPIKIGDKVVISGFVMRDNDGRSFIAAASIQNTKSGASVTLRDKNGTPVWSSEGQSECSDCADGGRGNGGSCNNEQ